MKTRTFRLLTIAAGTTLAFSGVARAQAPQAQGADEVRAVVSEMLADSETRSSLLDSGNAGHDQSFFVAGDNFRLNVGGQIQFRYIANLRDDDGAGDDFDGGFQTRRTKLNFNGKLNRDWDFKVQGAFNRGDGGSFALDDAWVRYNFPSAWKIRWGQFKAPLLREELIGSAYQLAAERSLTNEAFTQGRSQGVELAHEYECWRLAVAFTDGLRSVNTDFSGDGENSLVFRVMGEGDLAATGRIEALFAGDWKQFQDFTSPVGSDFGAMMGAAIHFQQSENTSDALDVDRQTFEYTADLSLEGDGWNVYGAFIGRHTKLETLLGTDPDFNDFGAIVQGGWRVCDNTEIFARWDALFVDSDRFVGDGEDTFNFITLGVNHYFAGHAAKLTIDGVYSVQETTRLSGLGILPETGAGLVGDAEDGEIAIRGQFQLLF